MDDRKAVLLDQLRMERAQSAPVSSDDRSASASLLGRRAGWVFGVGAVAASAALAAWFLVFNAKVLPVRAVVAKPLASTTSVSSSSSLLEASGYVIAFREATVSAKSIYKVTDVLVEEGQAVKQDEVIARLDDVNARAVLKQSRAQVRQLEAELIAAAQAAGNAQPSFQRAQKQLAAKLISQDAFDSAKAGYDAVQSEVLVAEEKLKVAKATIEVNERLLDDTIIRAPFDGVVTARTAQPGQIVSPQFLGGGGIAKIVDMDSLEVNVDVSETFINRVVGKQPAVVTLNAYPDWRIPAEVIAVIPTADRAKATVKVRIGFKERDPRIVPEMGARVSFLESAAPSKTDASETSPRAVIVPSETIQGNGDTSIAFVIVRDRIQQRSVQLGVRSTNGQIILSGVEPGASLAVGEFGKFRDGLKVQVVSLGEQ